MVLRVPLCVDDRECDLPDLYPVPVIEIDVDALARVLGEYLLDAEEARDLCPDGPLGGGIHVHDRFGPEHIGKLRCEGDMVDVRVRVDDVGDGDSLGLDEIQKWPRFMGGVDNDARFFFFAGHDIPEAPVKVELPEYHIKPRQRIFSWQPSGSCRRQAWI